MFGRRRSTAIILFLGIVVLVATVVRTVSSFKTLHRVYNRHELSIPKNHNDIIGKSDHNNQSVAKSRLVTATHRQQVRLKSETSNSEFVETSKNNESDDTIVLNSVTLEQLKKLCDQCHLSYDDDVINENDEYEETRLLEMKLQLLLRLRNHANQQADLERQRHIARKSKVEDQNEFNNNESYNSKERYEIVGSDDDHGPDDVDDDYSDEGYFFFDLPTVSDDLKQAQIESNARQQNSKADSQPSTILTSDQVTAPPPPIEPNANGERVVKIYSTTELNDLTSIAASQPGQNSLTSTSLDTLRINSDNQQQPWDYAEQQTSMATNHRYIEQAKEQLTELVSTLLALSGAPGFSNGNDDDDEDMGRTPYHPNNSVGSSSTKQGSRRANSEFVGFNPAKVPVELLTSSSKAIRASRGEALDEVLRQYELQGIGYDGMAGDNTSGGGGHYREVQKVRAFLEGYRRAEVRRLARETTSMLLNKIMIEGIDSLDMTLNTMIRSNDDTEDEYGGTQLNDSLLEFLNDAIRQKEKEINARYGNDRQNEKISWTHQLLLRDENDDIDDDLDQYWNVTEMDGQRIETFDPNNEQVKQIIQSKLETAQQQSSVANRVDIPETAPEQVLLLLKLLRERIKAEAAFTSDEKGRNLRLLAYCLHINNEDEREQFILKQLGNSLDRLDSFIELVTSSIEYGESTSYELQPATASKSKLDINEIRQILQLSMDLRHRQSIKASGVRP